MTAFDPRRTARLCATMFVAGVFAQAQAAEEAPPAAAHVVGAEMPDAAAGETASPFSANVTVTSQYISRGFRQTWGDPALQGGFDYAHPSGLFAGTWMSSVSSHFIEGASVEWDFYAGYAGSFGDIGYGATLYYYVYPGARLEYADVRYDYGEIVPSLSWKFFTAKYWLTWTEDYFGYNDRSLLTTATSGERHSRWSGYLDLNANFDVGYGVDVLLHYGHQNVRGFSFANWQDAKFAVSKGFGDGWLATLAVTRGWDKDGYFDNYTTGALNSAGQPEVSDPLVTTFFASLTRSF